MPGTGCMCSMTQVLPEDFEITSVRVFGSTPNPSAILNASLTATAATPAIRLLQIFATSPLPVGPTWMMLAPRHARTGRRSEEHTSELQSLAYLVCRLLLEKKNINDIDKFHLLTT